ncbi:MAG: carboxylating nicotinate-nucleotide diphosphorylase [Nitrospinae bacterium]|nr:carboxylating nicotinate-nucleotide diphosphorylase [Nitrospinota bacterium]
MDIRSKIRNWLLEDFGDAPLEYEAEKEPSCVAELRSKSDAILAGSLFFLPVLEETQNLLALGKSQSPEVNWLKDEGARISKGELLAHVSGHTQTILKAERTALNLLSHISEIATHTANTLACFGDFPKTFKGTIDTRKNRPGLRYFEKYAVRAGGGRNHRLGFFDGEMIKDNDIVAAGSIPAAIDRQFGNRYMTETQIEVQNLTQLEEVVEDGRVHMILLDNMDIETLQQAVARVREVGITLKTQKPYEIEASGIGGSDIRRVAETGVDYISTSSLVRSAPPLDFHMKITKVDL